MKFFGEKSTKSSKSWTAQERTQEFSSQRVFKMITIISKIVIGERGPFYVCEFSVWVNPPIPTSVNSFASAIPGQAFRWDTQWAGCYFILSGWQQVLWTASSQLPKSEPVLCWIKTREISKYCEPQPCHWWGHSATPEQCPQEAMNSWLVFVSNYISYCWYVSREHAVHLNHFHTKFGTEIIKYLFCAQNTAQAPYLLILHINSHRFCSTDNAFILKWWLWGIRHDWDV